MRSDSLTTSVFNKKTKSRVAWKTLFLKIWQNCIKNNEIVIFKGKWKENSKVSIKLNILIIFKKLLSFNNELGSQAPKYVDNFRLRLQCSQINNLLRLQILSFNRSRDYFFVLNIFTPSILRLSGRKFSIITKLELTMTKSNPLTIWSVKLEVQRKFCLNPGSLRDLKQVL